MVRSAYYELSIILQCLADVGVRANLGTSDDVANNEENSETEIEA